MFQAEHCPRLRAVRLRGCVRLTDAAAAQFLETAAAMRLRAIDLRGCPGLGSKTAAAMEWLPPLELLGCDWAACLRYEYALLWYNILYCDMVSLCVWRALIVMGLPAA